MECKTVNILGTEYKVIFETLEQNKAFKECDGYCDPTVKKLYIRLHTEEECKSDNFGYESVEMLRKKVIRHEIIHAFMYESGLWQNGLCADFSWAMNEEMVDWIAIQFPKILEAFKEAGAL